MRSWCLWPLIIALFPTVCTCPVRSLTLPPKAAAVGLILFVLNLKKGHYKFQFNQFGLSHMTILLVVCQAQFVIHNTFHGLFWFVFPALLVVWNDIMAYFCGFFFGRTPLIKLSPKKTWEGFIGGFLSTVFFGVFLCAFLSDYQYFTCPVTVQSAFTPSWHSPWFNVGSAAEHLFQSFLRSR